MSSPPVLETPRLRLYVPGPEAAGRLLAYVVDNRAHLAPWEPPLPADFFTEDYWRDRQERAHAELAEDKALRLVVAHRDRPDGPFVGVVNFTQFARGPFQACYLGYSLAADAVGQGYMLEALRPAIAHVFDALGFHRIMANHAPANERSGRVLRRLGFVVEGYARDYLFQGGRWRDHVLTALTNPNPRDPVI